MNRVSSRRRRVVSIVGTRPEAIKMAPVARALAARPRLEHRVVLTGQHKDLAPLFADCPTRSVQELHFDPASKSVPRLREGLHRLLCGAFAVAPVDLVLVHGDTASALAGAFAARDCGIALGHVEAGLRSFDFRQPWPEEGYRVAIDALADLLFAPTEAAAENLRRDPRATGRIFVTGNTGIDALLEARARVEERAVVRGDRGRKTILVTCHRKENQGEPVQAICAALRRLAREEPVEIAVLLHPNRHARRPLEEALAQEPCIRLLEPLPHGEMVRLMDRSWLILTDSGGLQEEGPALGTPVFVLREVTERPEGLASDAVRLVGTATQSIVDAVRELLHDPALYERMSRPSLPFGDGKAAPRIAEAVEAWLQPRRMRA
jgi:UDP-N-acetylglucosamine 2-epimerase